MHLVIAAIIAGVSIFLDLDRTFYRPEKIEQRRALNAWWWSFIALNALAAIVVAFVLADAGPFEEMGRWQLGLVFGLGYAALIRAKVTTITYGGASVPIGLELLYEAVKGFFLKRINLIVREARIDEAQELANSKPLADLADLAHLQIINDSLKTDAEKNADRKWITEILADDQISEALKRGHLATYILSGERSPVDDSSN